MIRTGALVLQTRAWLLDAGEDAQVVRSRGIGEDFPAKPDRLFIIARTGGPGLQTEGAFDVPTYQVRTRGRVNDPDDAEAMADLLDRIYLDTPKPLLIDGRHVTEIARVGSPPTEDRRDPGRRTHLTANYLIRLSRYAVVL